MLRVQMMCLPNFLGIGVQRGGTTWLHRQLSSHPEIYVPTKRKEIHFFDKYYGRGNKWYKEYFVHANRSMIKAIGEITPIYIYDPQAPLRIHDLIPECKFIIMLRNPVCRAFSQYQYLKQTENESLDFLTFINETPDAFERGLYSRQIERYFANFPRENFLILLFENVMENPKKALVELAEFLGVDPSLFRWDQAYGKVNSSYMPRFRNMYMFSRNLGKRLRSVDADWIVNGAKMIGIPKLFGRKKEKAKLDLEYVRYLGSRYVEDIKSLEEMLDLDLKIWIDTYNL